MSREERFRALPDSFKEFLSNPIAEMNPMAELLAVMDEMNYTLETVTGQQTETESDDFVTVRMPKEAFLDLVRGQADALNEEGEEYTQTVEEEDNDYEQTHEENEEGELIEK
jgi:hypothetical protein